MRKKIIVPKSIEKQFYKRYVPIVASGKFIISTPSQVLILRKPLLVKRKQTFKNYIFAENENMVYKISSLSNKDEILMQLLARECVTNLQIKVKIPTIKWWSNYKNFMIIAMEKAYGKKIINRPDLYKRIVDIENKLSKNNIFHNDWNKGNVFYDEIKDDLWLIDFSEATTTQNQFTNLTKFLA